MKVLLLSCSPSGELDEVASLLTKSLCAHKVQLHYELKSKTAVRFSKRHDSFSKLNVNLAEYDLIVLGIEKLGVSYVKSLKKMIGDQGISRKKVAFFYLDEQRAPFAHRLLLKVLAGNQIMGSLAIKDVQHNYHKYVIPIVQWANNIVSKCI